MFSFQSDPILWINEIAEYEVDKNCSDKFLRVNGYNTNQTTDGKLFSPRQEMLRRWSMDSLLSYKQTFTARGDWKNMTGKLILKVMKVKRCLGHERRTLKNYNSALFVLTSGYWEHRRTNYENFSPRWSVPVPSRMHADEKSYLLR